ncbi:MAG TPA: phosphatase PAP2 family protein, partial [Acidimicrobiales bacterium]|nr:phosphatase PAP2 family protein [Acidimicrobiales bacterium]
AELRCFAVLNGLPCRGFAPVWVLMQAGSLGGALLVSAAVRVGVDRRLGARMALVGSVTWLGAKAVKPLVRRGRPPEVVAVARILGREQTGLGYPSGHAAVAASLAAVAAPWLPARWRAGVWVPALLVGPARAYVGAHLPLDVLGGIAFGMLTGALLPCDGRARRSGADVDAQLPPQVEAQLPAGDEADDRL